MLNSRPSGHLYHGRLLAETGHPNRPSRRSTAHTSRRPPLRGLHAGCPLSYTLQALAETVCRRLITGSETRAFQALVVGWCRLVWAARAVALSMVRAPGQPRSLGSLQSGGPSAKPTPVLQDSTALIRQVRALHAPGGRGWLATGKAGFRARAMPSTYLVPKVRAWNARCFFGRLLWTRKPATGSEGRATASPLCFCFRGQGRT